MIEVKLNHHVMCHGPFPKKIIMSIEFKLWGGRVGSSLLEKN